MRHLASFALALFVLLFAAAAQAASSNGILLVAFGTSMESAKPSLDAVEAAYKKAYPGQPVVMAYTSDIIRNKLAKEGQKRLSVKQALDECAKLGVVNLRVQSLHATEGEEFSMLQRMLVRDLTRNPGRFEHVFLGAPLLKSEADLQEVITCVLKSFPSRRSATDAVVLMGHGNDRGSSDLALARVAAAFNERDNLVYVATVEGANSFDAVLPQLKKKGVRKVFLQPFMMVAGDHANNDLAGSEDDSWASQLKAAGMTVEAHLFGLGSNPGVQKLFLAHTAAAKDDLAHPKKSD